MTKTSKILQLEKHFIFYTVYKIQLFYSQAPMKGFQAAGEASSSRPLKRTHNFKTWNFLTIFVSHFCPYPDSQSLYGSTDSTGSGSNADPKHCLYKRFFYLSLEVLCIDDEAHAVTGLPEPDDRHFSWFYNPYSVARDWFLYPIINVVATHAYSLLLLHSLIVASACLKASCWLSCSSSSL